MMLLSFLIIVLVNQVFVFIYMNHRFCMFYLMVAFSTNIIVVVDLGA